MVAAKKKAAAPTEIRHERPIFIIRPAIRANYPLGYFFLKNLKYFRISLVGWFLLHTLRDPRYARNKSGCQTSSARAMSPSIYLPQMKQNTPATAIMQGVMRRAF